MDSLFVHLADSDDRIEITREEITALTFIPGVFGTTIELGTTCSIRVRESISELVAELEE